MKIHDTAVISSAARVHEDVEIGPYVVIDGPVEVGRGTRIYSHAVLTGSTHIGEENEIHMGAIIGHVPQDFSFTGAETFLKVGDRNVIREHAQIHRGSLANSTTIIGDENYIMQNAHIAHNCKLGNEIILAGGALLAGHVEVEDKAFISGNCVVHQFVKIGTLSLMRGLSRTSKDVPPYCIIDGTHTVRGLNLVGMRRAGITAEGVSALKSAYKELFRSPGIMGSKLKRLASEGPTPEVKTLVAFITKSKRGICIARSRSSNGQ